MEVPHYGRTKEKATFKIKAMGLKGGKGNKEQVDNGIDNLGLITGKTSLGPGFRHLYSAYSNEIIIPRLECSRVVASYKQSHTTQKWAQWSIPIIPVLET